MRYLCVHCDHRFEHGGDKKPRCPECMRVHGVEEVKADVGPTRRDYKRWGAAALVACALVGAYAYWRYSSPDNVTGEVPARPLEMSELRGHVRRLSADVGRDRLELFVPDDAIEAFAAAAVGDAQSPVERARAVVEAIRARATKGAFVRWSLSAPRDTPARDARRSFARLAEDGGGAHLYPIEVAAVAVSALRSQDVDAMVAEIFSFPGDREPPDPSGHLGYYGVAVYEGAPAAGGTPTILDPYSGHATPPEVDDYRVLNDVQALGAFLNHLAVHQLVRNGEPQRAHELCQNALKLDRRAVSIRSARGAILLASGAQQEGMAEFEAAAQLRRDAPRLNNLAGIAVAQRDADAASRYVAEALALHSDYAAAHATLAALHLAQDETDLARQELSTAERVDRDLPNLPMLWAQYFLATHDMTQASERALEAVELRPHDWQVRLEAARVMRLAGRYDEMRTLARAAMEQVPAEHQQRMIALIERLLGPTALEEPVSDALEEESDVAALPSADFQLSEESGLLGGDTAGPSLLGEDQGPLLKMGDTSKLRLGGTGQGGLRLRLNE